MARHSRTASRIFELELDCEPDCGSAAAAALSELLSLTTACACEEQKQVLHDAQQALAQATGPGGAVDLPRFAQLLALRGHLTWLRTGKPDCCGGQVALRHTFVLVGVPGAQQAPGEQPLLFVVDPCFRDSFALSNATPAFAALWQALPSLFVGTAQQLVPIVELMCHQMQQVFADSASSCPPWRTPSCMMTKWLPTVADDVPVVPTHAPVQRGASGSSESSGSSSAGASGPFAALGAGGCALLPPIRTTAPGAAALAGADDAGLTPRSARTPLYFEGGANTSARMLLSGSLDARSPDSGLGGSEPALAQLGASSGAEALLGAWAAHDGVAVVTTGSGGSLEFALACGGGSGYFGTSTAWGRSGGRCSSPGCEPPGALLRGGGGQVFSDSEADAPRKGVAIRRGRDSGPHPARGLAHPSSAARASWAAREQQLGAAALHVDRLSPAAGSGGGVVSPFGRTPVLRGTSSLDIRRFDCSSAADEQAMMLAALAGPPDWLAAAKPGGAKPPPLVSHTSCPPPVRAARGGSGSGGALPRPACSALSAAIAGKAVARR